MKLLTTKLLVLSFMMNPLFADESRSTARSRVRGGSDVVQTDSGQYVENPYLTRIREDRRRVFFEICMGVLPEYGKQALCAPYSRRITGENFKDILRSINKEFRNLDKRNRQIPRIVIDGKKFKRAYNENFDDGDEAYAAYFYNGPEIPKLPEEKPEKKPVLKPIKTEVRKLDVLDVAIDEYDTDVNNDRNKYQIRFEDDTPLVVEKVCTYKVSKQKVVTSRELRRCKALAKDLQGLSLADIYKGLNEDEIVDIDVPLDLLMRLYIGAAKTTDFNNSDMINYREFLRKNAEGLIIDDKPKVVVAKEKPPVAVVKPIVEATVQPKKKVVVEKPVVEKKPKEEVTTISIAKTGDNSGFTLTDEEIRQCADDISPAICRARLLEEKKKKLSQVANGVVTPKVEPKKEPVVEKPVILTPNVSLTQDEIDLQNKRDEKIGIIDDKDFNDKLTAINKRYQSFLDTKIKQECGEKPTQECLDRVAKENLALKNAELDKLIADYEKSKEPVVIVGKPIEPVKIDGVEEQVITDQNRKVAQVPFNCEDEIQNKLMELLEKDGNNILGKQFQLTSLKMALQVLERSTKIDTVETYLKSYQKELLNSKDGPVLDELVSFYRDHGKVEDSAYIAKSFKKLKNSSYWKQNTRVYNETASVFLLADSITNKDSMFSEVDVATTWFAEQVNKKFRIGSYHNNLTNLTSLTYRQLGVLKKERPIKLGNLRRRIGEKENELSKYFDQMKNQVAIDLSQCFEGEKGACWTDDAFNDRFSKSVMSLSQRLKTDDNFNVEMDKSLKGSLSGDVFKLDFLPRDRDI